MDRDTHIASDSGAMAAYKQGLRTKFNPLLHPVCLEFPAWLQHTSWAEHIPFAMYIVSALRPQVLVELGVYRGVSYCAFCQAVKELGLDTRCHGVDTWEGDGQAGAVEVSDLAPLRTHHDSLYGSFSELLQSTFESASLSFSDGSVDLLHIDGLHSYEATKRDFETWLPKMSRRGLMLFHDVNVRQVEFGVWKLWEEISAQYPHLTLLHGHGLGVLAVGSDYPEDVQVLLEASESDLSAIRSFFHTIGARVDAVRQYKSQCEEIIVLKDFETMMKKSPVIRAYQSLKIEGAGKFFGKVCAASKRKLGKRGQH